MLLSACFHLSNQQKKAFFFSHIFLEFLSEVTERKKETMIHSGSVGQLTKRCFFLNYRQSREPESLQVTAAVIITSWE